jgi:hypothetical protein
MTDVVQVILGSSIVTTIATGIISYLLHQKTERFNAEIKREFETRSAIETTNFEWKKQTAKLLGQVYIHLNRTRLAFENTYSKLGKYNAYFEDEIVYTSNKRIRDLILENGHHIPPELLGEASALVEHYDAWLVKYNLFRKVKGDINTIHIYVGPDGFSFPENAEEKFKNSYITLFNAITTLGK